MDTKEKAYLVLQVGHEGIERIFGIFTADKAVERITQLRAERDKYVEPEQYCIQRVTGDGAKCVCTQLGVSLLSEAWFY